MVAPPLPPLPHSVLLPGDAPTDAAPPPVVAVVAGWVLARVAGDSYFLGAALAATAHREGLDVAGLARRVGCGVAELPRLALYRRPNPRSPRFGAQVLRIADRTGADPIAVATLLREA